MGCFGGSEVKTPKPPKPTPEETRSNQLSLGVKEQLLRELGYDIGAENQDEAAMRMFNKPFDQLSPKQQSQVAKAPGVTLRSGTLSPEEQEGQAFEKQLRDYYQPRLLGQPISPDEQAEVENIFGGMQSRGEEDIRRQAIESAGSRGLNLTDSPIANELIRANVRLQGDLGGKKAETLFNLKQRNQLMAQDIIDTMNSLKQQQFMNRLNLAGGFGQQAQAAGSTRAATFRPMTVQSGGLDFGGLLGGAGKFLSGVAAF